MLRKQLTLLLGLALLLSQTRPAQGQSAAVAVAVAKSAATRRQKEDAKRLERIRRVVNKVGVGRGITVFLKNGDDLHGTVSRIGEEDFEVAEVDLKQLVTVRYESAEKVRSGYGGRNPFTGNRGSGPRRGTRIAMFGTFLFVGLALPVILIRSSKD